MYSCILGEEIISPTANRNIPRKTTSGDDKYAYPIVNIPAAATNNPKLKEAIALNFSNIREMKI
jgi:hypothetical protein